MSQTYLGQYASIQKRNSASAILDFTNEEWESLNALKEVNAAEKSQGVMANEINDIIWALGTENKTTRGAINKGAVYIMV